MNNETLQSKILLCWFNNSNFTEALYYARIMMGMELIN